MSDFFRGPWYNQQSLNDPQKVKEHIQNARDAINKAKTSIPDDSYFLKRWIETQ